MLTWKKKNKRDGALAGQQNLTTGRKIKKQAASSEKLFCDKTNPTHALYP